MPGRIKGANSDYEWVKRPDGKAGVVEVEGEDAYLQIFLCPKGAASRVEEHEGDQFCSGTDSSCPAPSDKSGHALVYLHQKEGVSLVADKGNRLVVDQDGRIRLLPHGGAGTLLEVTGEAVTVQVGPVKLVVRSGGIELVAGAADGQVTVSGDLKVSGAMNVTGNLTVGGTITGNGALTDQYRQILDKLAAGG